MPRRIRSHPLCRAWPLLSPLLLHCPEEMARAVDHVSILTGGLGRAVRPAARLGGFSAGQVARLRFVLLP